MKVIFKIENREIYSELEMIPRVGEVVTLAVSPIPVPTAYEVMDINHIIEDYVGTGNFSHKVIILLASTSMVEGC